MTYVHSLLDHVPSAIAVVGESGATRYRNRAFQDTFGSDAEDWLHEAARTVAGERGWLLGFFVDGDEKDVSVSNGRVPVFVYATRR